MFRGLQANTSLSTGVSTSSSAPALHPTQCRHRLGNAIAELQSIRSLSVQAKVATADHASLSHPPRVQHQSRRRAITASATASQQAPAHTATAAQSSENDSLVALRSRMQLYNTMAKSKQPFTTRAESPNSVQMYVCGVTVYDYSHIGHARVYVAFDLLYRLLSKALKYDVQYVRNFTDIDDKIIARALERGEDPLALSSRFIEEFHQDMRALNCLPPSQEPKATQHIPDMIAMIQKIISNGHAYALPDGDVYFEVATLPGYGALSGRQQEDNRAGERVAVDGRKRGPSDFALWKSAKPGEPSWESPWGRGRPGWHIECSAMIDRVMGSVIDIHGGGQDLVFPHHENELAQSRAAAGGASTQQQEPQQQQQQQQQQQCCGSSSSHPHSHSHGDVFVRYWVHNGFVNVNSEKMSKSLGNFFTIRDVLKLYHPLALRWFLLSTQYRAPVNYNDKALDEASSRLYYVYQALLDASAALTAAGEAGAQALAATTQGPSSPAPVVSALLDDLNTPAALAELSAPLKAINDLLTTKAGRKAPNRLALLAEHHTSIASALDLLGMLPQPGDQQAAGASGTSLDLGLQGVLGEMRALVLRRVGLTEEHVAARLQARAAARSAKDFAAADAVRLELAQHGLTVMDLPDGTSTWRPAAPGSK